jgi:hypothetical protein
MHDDNNTNNNNSHHLLYSSPPPLLSTNGYIDNRHAPSTTPNGNTAAANVPRHACSTRSFTLEKVLFRFFIILFTTNIFVCFFCRFKLNLCECNKPTNPASRAAARGVDIQ